MVSKRNADSLGDTITVDVDGKGTSRGPTPGVVFAGRYRIESELGRGGMGAVYRAVDTLVGDVVALKTLELGESPSESAIDRFRREVRLARRVSHPNVARTHDLGEVAGVHYLTMELVEGHDLEHLLTTETRVSGARAAALGIGIADGLAAAHAAGIVHRDLKPGNVLIEKATGRIVLTDFGIARGLVDEAGQNRTQGTVGTPLYMAPEQVRGSAVDGRTDVYALGLVLYELLTGKVPFLADTAIATAVARLDKAPVDPRTLVELDDALAEIVLRCLAREPENRPASAAEVASLLRSWSGVTTGATHALPVMDPGDRPATKPGVSKPPDKASGVRTPSLASTTGGYRTLAVLPIRYRGPKEHDYLGESLTEELVDVLSRTHGLRVLAAASTQKYKDERDPGVVGPQLGCDVLVDATAQVAGTQLRITVRLVDVRTSEVLVSDRFDAEIADVFEVQETISRRVAEALRVTLDVGAIRQQAPAGAIEAYMRGRKALSAARPAGPGGAYGHFEEALALAPDFVAAKAAHAVATVRAWFVPGVDTSIDWPTVAKASVARALAEAPLVAETHIAASQLALQRGEFRAAAHALTRALDIAPTFAQAHASLGSIEIEAGRPEQGRKRLKLAHELDPSSPFPIVDIARSYALHNRHVEAAAMLAKVTAREHPAVLNAQMRIAAWRDDREGLETVLALTRESEVPVARFTQIACEVILGVAPIEALAAFLAAAPPVALSPRFEALLHQVAGEVYLSAGDKNRGLKEISQAADGWLIDLEWLDLCPLIASVRDTPEFAEARRKVRARAEAIWSASA